MKQKQEKLETKMKWMLLSTMIPMTILIIVLLVFFWHYTNEYNQLSNNLAVSSEYNANYRNSNNDMSFKDEVDMDIYYVTIGRKGKDGLPTEQVDKAISTVESLKKTTSKKESLRSLKYLTNYLENLKKRMNQLLEIKNYQERQEFVANNTEILTTLFEKEMQNYIYQEATELVQIESQLAGNVRLTIITMCAAILVATAILLRRSFRLTYSITKPISEILHNIKKVGKGEYKTINVVSADSVEIQELDAGTRKMAGRIEGLLENVRKEQEVQHMTELQLIQAQVNPHFLYNTLDTIVWLVEGGMQQDAVDMITSLSVFFRTSLSKGKDIIPLSEEKRHTLSYLEIQQSRYRDIMEFEINIPPTVVIALIVVILIAVLLKYRKFGRKLYAIGGSRQSALMMGLNVKKTIFNAYVLDGFLAGLGGFLFCLNSCAGFVEQAKGLEMDAISSAVIGGTLLSGGVGTPIGTLFGVLIKGTISSLITTQGTLSSWWTRIILSALLCFFIVIQSVVASMKKKAK